MKQDAELEQFWNDFVQSHPYLQGQRFFEAFRFGDTENTANELAALVVSGVKTATSSLLWTLEQEQQPIVQTGDYSIVTDWEHRPVCIILTTEVNILPFKDVDARFAYDYGEAERTLVWWQQHIWDYYVKECASIGRQATETMPLVCERFQVVYQR
jgi:uncharacterized protein YhfF